MKYKKIMLVTFVLLAILTLGAVSASEDIALDDELTADAMDEVSVDASYDDEIISEEGGDSLASSDDASALEVTSENFDIDYQTHEAVSKQEDEVLHVWWHDVESGNLCLRVYDSDNNLIYADGNDDDGYGYEIEGNDECSWTVSDLFSGNDYALGYYALDLIFTPYDDEDAVNIIDDLQFQLTYCNIEEYRDESVYIDYPFDVIRIYERTEVLDVYVNDDKIDEERNYEDGPTAWNLNELGINEPGVYDIRIEAINPNLGSVETFEMTLNVTGFDPNQWRAFTNYEGIHDFDENDPVLYLYCPRYMNELCIVVNPDRIHYEDFTAYEGQMISWTLSDLDIDCNGDYDILIHDYNMQMARASLNLWHFGDGEEEDEDDWILDYNSDLITFRHLVMLSDRFDSGRLEITDSEGNVLFNKSVSEMEPNHDMMGYKYDQYDGYVVFKEDLNTDVTGVYDLTITYYDDEGEIVESVDTTVYLDYTSYVTDDEIDITDYNSTLFSFYVFDIMNDGSILIEIIAGEDDDDEPFITSTFDVEDWMTDATCSYTRQEFSELDEGIYTVHVKYVPNNEDPDDHYVHYWKYSYFHDARITVVDNTKFRVRMESDSILDEDSQFLVYCPEGSVGKTITIEVALDDNSNFFEYDITNESCYASFALDILNITVPGQYRFDIYDEYGEKLIETYECEIGNPLWIPEVCVLGAEGLERTMVAVLYIDETDDGRLVLTDGDGVILFDEALTDSYYHSLGYDKGYYILYSDFDPALNAGTYNVTASYYKGDILRLTTSAEIRIVERNYIENDDGVSIELYDYYAHDLNDDEDSIAWVAVPEFESGYVRVVLMDDEYTTRGDFTFDEIDDDDGLPTFFVSLFDRDVEEGDYLVIVAYFDGDDNPVLNSSAWMSFYYGDDDDGSFDSIEFYIIENDDEEKVFEIGDNVHVASLWIPDNEEYGTTVATITVTKNYEPFATFVTSNMEPVYHEDKDVDENQIFLDLTQFSDKDIIEFNVDCIEDGFTWSYAIEINGDEAIFHDYCEMVDYYVFYGNITTGDLNNPELMGPHPNGDFVEFFIPDSYNVQNGSIVVSDGETVIYSKSLDEFDPEYSYDILGNVYVITLDEFDLMTLPENTVITVTLNYESDSITLKRIRIGDYVSKIVTPDDVARLYTISVTDDGIFDQSEIVVNIMATDDANRQSIYIDIGGGHFSVYVNDVKIEGLGEILLRNWIYESGVLDADPEGLADLGLSEEYNIDLEEFAELDVDEKVSILEEIFASEFGSEIELFRMTSYCAGCPELFLDSYDLGIDQTGIYNIKITHTPDPYEPEPGCPVDDCVFYDEVVILDTDVTVILEKIGTVLSADNLVMEYKDGSEWTVTLSDVYGNLLDGADVIITISCGGEDIDYTLVTDDEGNVGLPINLAVGSYEISASFEGDDLYEDSFTSAFVIVNKASTMLYAEDLEMRFKDGSAWAVTLTDANGKAISNVKVGIGVAGKVYNIRTDADGVAQLTINLARGVYEINATFAGSDNYEAAFTSAIVTVQNSAAILTASDLVMAPKDGSAWSVTLTDSSGKPISGVKVAIGILGKVYNIKTDADGVASLTIGLGIGVYEINASYAGTSKIDPGFVNATITVRHPPAILTADDLVMAPKDGSAWAVTLTDANGNTLANAAVKFGILGKIYTIKTNENGVASLPISLVRGVYEINATFEGTTNIGPAFVNATVTVKYPSAVLIGSDMEMIYHEPNNYSVTLTDPSGNAISNAVVKITINNVTYNRRTDENGVASLPINLYVGTYAISARFEGNNQFSEVEITNTIVITRS